MMWIHFLRKKGNTFKFLYSLLLDQQEYYYNNLIIITSSIMICQPKEIDKKHPPLWVAIESKE